MKTRSETDALGTVQVPEDAYYGAQTQRARENFPVSAIRMPLPLVRSLGLIKRCAAVVNHDLGLIETRLADAIIKAAREVEEGLLDDQFVLDVFQTGSGTSTNMNVNEVVAGRANELLTGKRGGKDPVHPNDHVNRCQSSNDVFPSAIHIAAVTEIRNGLLPSLDRLHGSLLAKAEAFADVIKLGRTHLQDAVPIRLGQEFGGYARQVELAVRRIEGAAAGLLELALGGTAVGTGMNAHPDFAARTIALIVDATQCPFFEAVNHFEAQGAQDAAVAAGGALKSVAVGMGKIANDLRWLASGPRCGLGEITLPSLQPGSSIMPGKVNPVIPEVVIQVAAQVVGNDAAITLGGQWGFFELNTMLPVIGHNLLQSIALLASSARLLAEKCIDGIEANRERCKGSIEQSLALATYLAPTLGYDRASAISKEAYVTGKTIRELVLEKRLMDEAEFDRLINESLSPLEGIP